jgi:alpha-glucosidase (family GH31 glycosyl hydrolase)
MVNRKQLISSLAMSTVLLAMQSSAYAEVFRKKFNASGKYLVVEILDDDLAHFEFSAIGDGPLTTEPLYTSPMVLKTDYPGTATAVSQGGDAVEIIETSEMRLAVDKSTLCVEVIDKTKNTSRLTTICPESLSDALKGINIEPGKMQNVYGLGQEFKQLGSSDGDWIKLGVREGRDGLGNGFQGFQQAAVGNVQIPVFYAVGADNLNYALFMDNVYWQKWDFKQTWWQARMYGDQLRFYVMTGKDLADLRSDFMELTGKPPVPPRKAFGLWVSEFGYDNWEQIDILKDNLRTNKFPVDGFVLDLNWFGGISPRKEPSDCTSPKNSMGRLSWDADQDELAKSNEYSFPDSSKKIKEYAEDNIRLAAIEESYVANTTDTFNVMPKDLLAYQRIDGKCDSSKQQTPVVIKAGDFWGCGQMFDWSDTELGKWIHENRRFPELVKRGINTHWTDLGEPERFDPSSCYEGVEATAAGKKNAHADIHNIYNLLWNKSIWDGYIAKQGQADELGVTNPRPLILTRSGAAGTQRYGAAMWSGDIASNLESLATHSNAQMHMSFSGIDYYGADIGGFRREVLPGNSKDAPFDTSYQDELYTQWFANGSWFDTPVRPHTDNEFGGNRDSCKKDFGHRQPPCYETAPSLVGKRDSNLANIRQRYELIPYYYSLAYRAYLKGEPVVLPPVLYYQNDPKLREAGNEKMIGKDILVGIVAKHGEYERNVYLPKGRWVNYHSNEWFNSSGEEIQDVPVYREGIFRLPAFVRAGAILPQMFVDEKTKDAFNNRVDGSPMHDELIVRVYADETPTTFTLYEDDGSTLDYKQDGQPLYHYRTTDLKQQKDNNTVTVTVSPAFNKNRNDEVAESFTGAVKNRSNLVKLIVNNAEATAVSLNDKTLTQYPSQAEFDRAVSGWCNAGHNLILAKSDKVDVNKISKSFAFQLRSVAVTTSVNFVCDAGFTTPGQSIYVTGSIGALGNWDAAKAVKLNPNIYYEYIQRADKGLPGPTKPVWTGVIDDLPPNTAFEWKCIRRQENDPNQVQWQSGDNNKYTTSPDGYAGKSYGTF